MISVITAGTNAAASTSATISANVCRLRRVFLTIVRFWHARITPSDIGAAKIELVNVVNGSVQGMAIDGKVEFFWWGQEEGPGGPDTVANFSGRVLIFDSAVECAAAATSAGWLADASVEINVIDALPTQQWLRHEHLALNPSSALDVLNLALDFARATQNNWDPRVGNIGRCYDKLFTANVPYFYDLDSYLPQWNRYEISALRAALARAIAILRATP